jgi:hypothetical protein
MAITTKAERASVLGFGSTIFGLLSLPDGANLATKKERQTTLALVARTLTNQNIVPDLTGRTLVQADGDLAAVSLVVGMVVYTFHASVAAGLIYQQVPLAGVDAPDGSSVAVVVSKGVDPGGAVGRTIHQIFQFGRLSN